MKCKLLIIIIFIPFWVFGGTTVIEVRTDGWGTISKKSGETNQNGAMVWNGGEWVVNNTWAHKYFHDTRTGTRLKTIDSIQISREGQGIMDTLGFQIIRQNYNYSHADRNGGTYHYSALEYLLKNKVTGKQIVLRSRGTGNGTAQHYFDIYIQNEDTTGLLQSYTVFRNDPEWYTYSGITLEQVLAQTDTLQGKTGKLTASEKGSVSPPGWFFLDIGGGGDLGPAGIGKSFVFRTDSLRGANIAAGNAVYAVDFALRWMDNIVNIHEFRFSPRLFSEAYTPALGTEARNKEPDWVRFNASGLFTPTDQPADMALDKAGNIYVTGSSEGYPWSTDYLTLKYDVQGNLLWSSRYNNGANDNARKLTVDGNGNVYITGMSFNPETYYDIVTIKYSSIGEKLWLATYNGTGNLWDEGRDIAVDPAGNVYVTGRSESSADDYDMITIKYNASGAEQWVKRYNGAAGWYDGAEAMALDAQGNVYVSGYSRKAETAFDFVTIKYDANGGEQWVKSNSNAGNSHNNPISVVVDNSGNLILAGTKTGAGQFNDFITVKYNPAGNELWVRNYNGPGNASDGILGVAADGTGNVYVTGYSQGTGTGYDYATVKYNSSGTEQWVKRFTGTGNGSDYAVDVTFDASGQILVTGYSEDAVTGYDYATVKYKPDGSEMWVKKYHYSGNSYDEPAVVRTDVAGNIIVTGYSKDDASGFDFATVKYNSEGNELWVRRHNGTGNSQDLARAVAADKAGNAYVTGSSDRAGSGQDYVTLKYNSQGKVLWLARYNGPANSFDQAAAIAVDSLGNVYVTGSSSDGSGNDYATVKYNPEGIPQWVKRYNGTGNSFDDAKAIAVDRAGNVYVTGMSTGTSQRYDYTTIKYNSGGAEQWVARYNGPGNADDQAYALAVDEAGNVYITGSSGGSGTKNDYCTIKYNQNGSELWVKRYNGPNNSFDNATDIALDKSGNVFVTGNSPGSGTLDDFATIKYNSSGVEQWVKRYNGPANSNDVGMALATDVSGNVYVTGSSTGAGSGYDYATIKYNTAGTEQWIRRYNGPRSDNDDQVEDIAIDDSSYVYVTGHSRSMDNRAVVPVTVRYTPQGTESWVARYNKPDCYYGFETRIATSGAQAVFVSTSILNDNISWSIYATLKYSTGPQANPYLMVTPDDIPFLPDAGRKASLTVNTNTTWKAVAEKPWISLSPSSGSGNETVEVTVDTLMSNQTRTGKVTFTAAGITPQTVTLTQEAARLTLSGNAFPIGYAAGSTVTFSISGNTSWTINTGQPWLSASLVSGKGNAVIVLTAQANKEPGNRSATVTVSGTGLEPQTITVTQSLNTGMSDHEKAEITVYPNPFTNEFRVSGLKNTAVFSLSDVSGKLLLYRKLNFDELITAGSIPAGFYIIRILTPRESWEGKIIKK